MSNEEKIDKDLQLEFNIPFQVLWLEQPDGNIAMQVRYSDKPEVQLVVFQAVASFLEAMLAEDTTRAKGAKMKPALRTRYKEAAAIAQEIASGIGKKVYDEQIEQPDTRIQLLKTDIN